MAHTVIDNKFYVDTAFLNSLGGIPGVSLEHMGFGEFYAKTPMGTVDFDRMRGKDFLGQSGRSHKAYDREGYGTKATEWLIDQVESKGKSVRVARSPSNKMCDASTFSAAWITSEGKVIPMPGDTHSKWAERYVESDPGYQSYTGTPVQYLRDRLRWVRLVNGEVIDVGPKGSTGPAMEAVVDIILGCVTANRRTDPEASTVLYGVGGRATDVVIADFVTKHGTTAQISALYDHLEARDVALRKNVIRLAAARPDLREHLLPLVREAAAVVPPEDAPKVGDILYSSWGYDQTNIDFYEVRRVMGSMIVIQELENKIVRNDGPMHYVVPITGQYKGAPLRRKFGPRWNGKGYAVSVHSSASASLWDGTPKGETGWGYGH